MFQVKVNGRLMFTVSNVQDAITVAKIYGGKISRAPRTKGSK